MDDQRACALLSAAMGKRGSADMTGYPHTEPRGFVCVHCGRGLLPRVFDTGAAPTSNRPPPEFLVCAGHFEASKRAVTAELQAMVRRRWDDDRWRANHVARLIEELDRERADACALREWCTDDMNKARVEFLLNGDVQPYLGALAERATGLATRRTALAAGHEPPATAPQLSVIRAAVRDTAPHRVAALWRMLAAPDFRGTPELWETTALAEDWTRTPDTWQRWALVSATVSTGPLAVEAHRGSVLRLVAPAP